MHDGLRSSVAFDGNIGAPEIAPRGAMSAEQGIEAARARGSRQREIFRGIAAPPFA